MREHISPILLDQKVPIQDKIRLILLSKKDISEAHVKSLLKHAEIPDDDTNLFDNINNLGEADNIKRKKRVEKDEGILSSRWTPIIKDIIEDAIDDKLDKEQ